MKTPQEIATTILGKEPTLNEERIIWRSIVEGIEADRAQTRYATGEDWSVEQREVADLGMLTALVLWPAGTAGMTGEPVAVLSLTSAGVDALVDTLKPGA